MEATVDITTVNVKEVDGNKHSEASRVRPLVSYSVEGRKPDKCGIK